mmetsp:Transcript_3072/g.9223  ORF Transcript_3072/g.9223 Transcript_3072/m.9223 type:complete len:287 (-) Transcript_3072:640-1500(-)
MARDCGSRASRENKSGRHLVAEELPVLGEVRAHVRVRHREHVRVLQEEDERRLVGALDERKHNLRDGVAADSGDEADDDVRVVEALGPRVWRVSDEPKAEDCVEQADADGEEGEHRLDEVVHADGRHALLRHEADDLSARVEERVAVDAHVYERVLVEIVHHRPAAAEAAADAAEQAADAAPTLGLARLALQKVHDDKHGLDDGEDGSAKADGAEVGRDGAEARIEDRVAFQRRPPTVPVRVRRARRRRDEGVLEDLARPEEDKGEEEQHGGVAARVFVARFVGSA